MKKTDEERQLDRVEEKELESLCHDPDIVALPSTLTQVREENRSGLHSYYGIFFALMSTLFVSISTVFIKKAELFTGTELTSIRFGLQLIIALLIAYFNDVNIFGPRKLINLLVLRGILGMFALTMYHVAVKFIKPSDATTIVQMNIIFVAFIARFTLKEKFSFFHIISMLMAVTGYL